MILAFVGVEAGIPVKYKSLKILFFYLSQLLRMHTLILKYNLIRERDSYYARAIY